MFRAQWFIALAALLNVVGCAGPKSGAGFTLPDGNSERGQAVFVSLRCHECHTVSGIELPKLEGAKEPLVRLGGKVARISTYGELVTSIINPSHKLARGYAGKNVTTDGKSPMRNYNDVMTVSELIDLVAFLQSRYELLPQDPTPYPLYN